MTSSGRDGKVAQSPLESMAVEVGAGLATWDQSEVLREQTSGAQHKRGGEIKGSGSVWVQVGAVVGRRQQPTVELGSTGSIETKGKGRREVDEYGRG